LSKLLAVGRPRNTAERRAQIVDALLVVMAREGYEHATIQRIAREAQILPGLVHYHFATKQAILVALVGELARRIAARVETRLAAAPDEPRARLHAFLDAHVALGAGADPRAVAAWVLVAATAVRDAEVRAIYTGAVRGALTRLHDLVRDVLADEGRTQADAPRIGAGILSAIEGAYLVSAAAPGVLPAGYAAPMLRRMADGLLDAQKRGSKGRKRRAAARA
jgi:TetR/AcrR family transcriptional repressor of bet genes